MFFWASILAFSVSLLQKMRRLSPAFPICTCLWSISKISFWTRSSFSLVMFRCIPSMYTIRLLPSSNLPSVFLMNSLSFSSSFCSLSSSSGFLASFSVLLSSWCSWFSFDCLSSLFISSSCSSVCHSSITSFFFSCSLIFSFFLFLFSFSKYYFDFVILWLVNYLVIYFDFVQFLWIQLSWFDFLYVPLYQCQQTNILHLCRILSWRPRLTFENVKEFRRGERCFVRLRNVDN